MAERATNELERTITSVDFAADARTSATVLCEGLRKVAIEMRQRARALRGVDDEEKENAGADLLDVLADEYDHCVYSISRLVR